jgi:hypothetical protein
MAHPPSAVRFPGPPSTRMQTNEMSRSMRSLVLVLIALGLPGAEFPSVTLSNDLGFEPTVYPPDPEGASSRGTRLDHAGMVGELRYRGHTVFAPWRAPHDPTAPDHGIGLAGEFDIDGPHGFETTAKGEPFLKLGVGKLLRPDATGRGADQYFFNHRYDFAEPPQWSIEHDATSLRCSLSLSLGEQAHTYLSVVAVEPDAPAITITHSLSNTGSAALATEHYSHHFFTIDQQPIGAGYALTTSFVPQWEVKRSQRFSALATLDGHTLRLTAAFKGALYTPFEIEGSVADNAFTLTAPNGVAVRYRGDLAPSRWALYAETSAFCPEPFVSIELAPGETETWTRRYEIVLPE